MHAVAPKVVLRAIEAPMKGEPNVPIEAEGAQPIIEGLLFIGVMRGMKEIGGSNWGQPGVACPGEKSTCRVDHLKLREHRNK
jgi:hypothetical protein